MNALNDPVVSKEAIDYDVFRANENCVLGTNKGGGHLGYHESIFTFDQWFMKPVVAFLNAYRDDIGSGLIG